MPFGEEFLKNDKISENFSSNKDHLSTIVRGAFIRPKTKSKADNSSKPVDSQSRQDPGEIAGWRRAIIADTPAIRRLQKLTGRWADKLYRRRNISEMIEKSYFPLVQVDNQGEVVSFTVYDPFPNIPAVPSFSWKEWLRTSYRLKDANPRNVLFVHYMVWQPRQSRKFLEHLLKASFTEFLYLEHVIIVKPPHSIVPDFYSDYFVPVLPHEFEKLNFNSVQSLLVCLRSSIVESLPIRPAFQEEFDDFFPMFENELEAKYTGSSLDIVSLIYSDEKKTLICHFEGKIVGIMILDLTMDIDYLDDGFELAPFSDLKKRSVADNDSYEYNINIYPQQSSTRINPDLLASSEFLFNRMNWPLLLKNINRDVNSSLRLVDSWESFTSSEYSEYSEIDSATDIQDQKKSELDLNPATNTATCSTSKNEVHNSKPADVKLKTRTSIQSVPHFYFPKYRGLSNAFLIDFFAVDSAAVNEKLASFDFLQAAFRYVPDRDYCILIIPTDLLPFPLLELFTRVTPRLMASLKRELYLCHKNSLHFTSMTVRYLADEDLLPMRLFLKNVNDSNKIFHDLLKSFGDLSKYRCLVLVVGDKIVGVSLIDVQDYTKTFNTHYDISEFNSKYETENTAVIKHLILSPIYNIHARFYVREVMRLADTSCLFYYYNERHKSMCNMLTVLGDLIPIKPKKKVVTGVANFSLSNKHDEVSDAKMYSLHLTNINVCGLRKFPLNIVIVVVGGSRTALSFLENLIFGSTRPYIIYNNLICVTPHGFDVDCLDKDVKNLMFPIRDPSNTSYLTMLSVETYVNFVYGVMTQINRSEKYIIVNNKVMIRYDYLVLTCGLQYIKPTPKARELPKARCKKFYRSSLARYLFRPEPKIVLTQSVTKVPLNMFIINTMSDAKNALHSLKCLMSKIKGNIERKIVVYGHNLRVFLTINTLLKLGIPGEIIAFIEPFPTNDNSVTVFNDNHVDKAVLQAIRDLNISHYKEYILYDWSLVSEDITSLTFQSHRKQIIIPCLAFFPFAQKMVSEVSFHAIVNAGLVYDGKLVINSNFKTNDKYIYAAGPLTKYSRRYFAYDHDHQYYSSREVGKKLATVLRSKIHPNADERLTEPLDIIPALRDPIIIYCQLPGEFNFYTLRKPGKELDLETAYNFVDYGEVLTTGDCKQKRGFGYFRLHLNAEGFVESITCFTKNKIDYINLTSLYGLHERLLNNLLLRYDLGLIPDLFSYFQERWTEALYHDCFDLLRNENYKAFRRKLTNSTSRTFIEKIIWKLRKNRWRPLPDSTRRKIQAEYENSVIEQEIKMNLIEFLECHSKDLVVYAAPSIVNSLLFEKAK